jgi:3-deoxy-D-arabino-heptulosonate 7-phosphate (DAHP) synthase
VRKEADEFRVFAADLYNDGRIVNTLRGDYLAPKVSAEDTAKNAAKEARVKQLADAILKNEQSIVEEVIRQMDAKRVTRIIDVLSVQDPDVVTEVVAKLKGSLWKSYEK